MEVPEIVLVATLDPIQAEVTETPGAHMFTHAAPKFEKVALASFLSVAPTDQTKGVLLSVSVAFWEAPEGEELQALALLFPAATTTNTPSLEPVGESRPAAITASSTAAETPPPSERFITDFLPFVLESEAAQFIPLITPA